jgi:hypothetical protein
MNSSSSNVTRPTRNEARDPARGLAQQSALVNSIPFDDDELRNWLMECVEDGSENFLCAVAEAAFSANTEDYAVILPALLALKERHDTKRGNVS